ncbi:MAG: 1,5-anhydro-D-fructose reductase [Candidatus Izimaplasma bacterium HR2]|nr:MAG: 1,5-anhydro-D-fructose reductase [Candidatus Izimaplasma bacterium HR2]
MIRFGIVGAGVIAHTFAKDIKLVEGAVLVAIASRNINKANDFREEYNLDLAFGSYEEMALSNSIDAVYIATPHNFHKDQSILFMNNSKHVLCEKPISVNSVELEEMIKNAKKNKVLLMEAMWTRYLPSFQKVKEVVESNVLGKFKKAYLELGWSLINDYSVDKRLLNMDLAGGSILDIGVYPIACFRYINKQDISKFNASASFHNTGVDTECIIDLEFNDGSRAKLKSSIKETLMKDAIFEFDNGKIIMNRFHSSESIYINGEHFNLPFKGLGFVHEIESFVDTINKGLLEDPIMTYSESRDIMKIMDMARNEIGLKYPFE